MQGIHLGVHLVEGEQQAIEEPLIVAGEQNERKSGEKSAGKQSESAGFERFLYYGGDVMLKRVVPKARNIPAKVHVIVHDFHDFR